MKIGILPDYRHEHCEYIRHTAKWKMTRCSRCAALSIGQPADLMTGDGGRWAGEWGSVAEYGAKRAGIL